MQDAIDAIQQFGFPLLPWSDLDTLYILYGLRLLKK